VAAAVVDSELKRITPETLLGALMAAAPMLVVAVQTTKLTWLEMQ
jgi:hypothetical protein